MLLWIKLSSFVDKHCSAISYKWLIEEKINKCTEDSYKLSFCKTLFKLFTAPIDSSKAIQVIKQLDWVISNNIPPAKEEMTAPSVWKLSL